jgi:hypothetical protein
VGTIRIIDFVLPKANPGSRLSSITTIILHESERFEHYDLRVRIVYPFPLLVYIGPIYLITLSRPNIGFRARESWYTEGQSPLIHPMTPVYQDTADVR